MILHSGSGKICCEEEWPRNGYLKSPVRDFSHQPTGQFRCQIDSMHRVWSREADPQRKTSPEKQVPCTERISPKTASPLVCCSLNFGQPVPLKSILCSKVAPKDITEGRLATYHAYWFNIPPDSPYIQPRWLTEEWTMPKIQLGERSLWG